MRLRKLPVLLALAAIAAGNPGAADTQTAKAETHTAWGLHTTTFDTLQGRVVVHLPADAAAGDTLSGSVYAEPAGDDEKTRNGNREKLSALVITVAGARAQVGSGRFRASLPASLDDGLVPLALKNPGGTSLAGAAVPASTSAAGSPLSLELPRVAQAGRPVSVGGAFDGDASTTVAELGGESLQVLAESPRRAVLQVPPDALGVEELEVREGSEGAAGTTATGPLRVLAVHLSADDLDLRRGQTTELRVTVSGLEGLQEPVPLAIRNQSPSVVRLQGGDTQTLDIGSGDVSADGEFLWRATLVGITPGSFAISASVPYLSQPEPVPPTMADAVSVGGRPEPEPGPVFQDEDGASIYDDLIRKIRELEERGEPPDWEWLRWKNWNDGIAEPRPVEGRTAQERDQIARYKEAIEAETDEDKKQAMRSSLENRLKAIAAADDDELVLRDRSKPLGSDGEWVPFRRHALIIESGWKTDMARVRLDGVDYLRGRREYLKQAGIDIVMRQIRAHLRRLGFDVTDASTKKLLEDDGRLTAEEMEEACTSHDWGFIILAGHCWNSTESRWGDQENVRQQTLHLDPRAYPGTDRRDGVLRAVSIGKFREWFTGRVDEKTWIVAWPCFSGSKGKKDCYDLATELGIGTYGSNPPAERPPLGWHEEGQYEDEEGEPPGNEDDYYPRRDVLPVKSDGSPAGAGEFNSMAAMGAKVVEKLGRLTDGW